MQAVQGLVRIVEQQLGTEHSHILLQISRKPRRMLRSTHLCTSSAHGLRTHFQRYVPKNGVLQSRCICKPEYEV